jgi:sodium transport system permease protein
MHALLRVFRKEFLENLRDRRTLFSALALGPLLGPLLFGVMVSRMLNQTVLESDEPLKIEIAGGERAPNLASFLESHGVRYRRVVESAESAREAVRHGAATVVLIVPSDYAERFRAAQPAPLLVIADSSDSQTRKSAERLKALLAAYGSGIAEARLKARGVDPLTALPVAIQDIDAATSAGRAVVILGFTTYFVLFAVLMGGLYLAIDSTAGERERGSLEALLSLPVARSALVGGKMLATSAYMCASLAISLSAFVCVLRFVPLERLGMSANLGPATALEFFAICLPFVPLGAIAMMLVASFARSYREAQTYLTSVLLVPTLPIAFASIYSLKTKSSLMLIPSLSQHLLMTSILKDQEISLIDASLSAGSALLFATLLFIATARHWRRETMLG